LSEIIFSDPCILFALRREAMFFRREFPPHQRFPGAPCRACFSGPSWLTVLVLETGVGPAAVESALGWALGEPLFGGVPYRPRVVLSAGFSGALRPGLRVGDLVLATDVVDEKGNHWPATWPADLGPGDWRPPLHRGRLLGVPDLVADPVRKRGLGAQHQALGVDMETATVARLCGRAGVPFGCLRAISDDGDTALSPKLAGILHRGRVAPWRLAGTLLRRPAIVGELWRLARDTRRAARQLALGLGGLLTLTLPWTREGNGGLG
jgi:adenosylhomocysteine nucleosidase